ncbi:hypothetical protein ACFOEQ_21745 [Chryseobacterium arachidis]|uniref:hypothetical protein n=1 Tax=Chryseobacterium arachidis TaxID=1416778 RepID=UPI003618741A
MLKNKHKFYTDFAKQNWQPLKEKNIKKIEKKLEKDEGKKEPSENKKREGKVGQKC